MEMGEQTGGAGGFDSADYGQRPYDDVTALREGDIDPDLLNTEVAVGPQSSEYGDEHVNGDLRETIRDVLTAIDEPERTIRELSGEVELVTGALKRVEEQYAATKLHFEADIAGAKDQLGRTVRTLDAAEYEIVAAFKSGRTTSWRQMQKTEDGHAVGEQNLLTAVILSPEGDRRERPDVGEARILTALGVNELVKADVPVLLSIHKSGQAPEYCAAIPGQDGLSVRLDDRDADRPVYRVGVGGQTNFNMADAWAVIQDGDEPVYALPNFEIESGTAAVHALTDDCRTYVNAYGAVERAIAGVLEEPATDQFATQYRGLTYDRQILRESMIAAVNAAREIGVRLDIGPADQRAAIAIREHMFELGDADAYEVDEVRAAAIALRHIYPRDAMVPVQDFVINASRQRGIDTRQGHRQGGVANMLEEVFGMEHEEATRVIYGNSNE